MENDADAYNDTDADTDDDAGTGDDTDADANTETDAEAFLNGRRLFHLLMDIPSFRVFLLQLDPCYAYPCAVVQDMNGNDNTLLVA